MKTYNQLTQEQRYQIYALKKTNHTLSEIAAVRLGCISPVSAAS